MKRLTAAFYRTEDGTEPVRDWLTELSRDDRRVVGTDIATVEFGWPIGMPVCRPLRGGLLEVRSTIRSGKVEARIRFTIEEQTMLLLHGSQGKDRQAGDIELAEGRLRDHRRRKSAGERR